MDYRPLPRPLGIMTSQKTDRTQPSVRITMPWAWPNCKAPRAMQSTPQTVPTITSILIDLRARRRAADDEGSLPVVPFLVTGTTPPYSPASILAPNGKGELAAESAAAPLLRAGPRPTVHPSALDDRVRVTR